MAGEVPFGCGRCFQASAEEAEEARNRFEIIAWLVDESHYGLSIRACPHCGQRCIDVFTEVIDWSGGDDAQYWSYLPLTFEESEHLIARGKDVRPAEVELLGRDRRYLMVDFPTGKPKRVRWAQGPLWIGFHD